jgi:hypothetical protein
MSAASGATGGDGAARDARVAGDKFEIVDGALEAAVEPGFLPSLVGKSASDLLFLAQMAERTENFEDMRVLMRQLVQVKPVLSDEERSLLSLAYKHVVGKRRSAWRRLWSMVQSEQAARDADCDELAAQACRTGLAARGGGEGGGELHDLSAGLQCFDAEGSSAGAGVNEVELDAADTEGSHNVPLSVMVRAVRAELEQLCLELIGLVHSHLLPRLPPDAVETVVFYKKLVGDYYRYLSEYTSYGSRKDFINAADVFYSEALALAVRHLSATHTLRLGLALNTSVFYFEIMNTPDKACELAKSTYDAAVAAMDTYDDDRKEPFMLLDLLRENLTIWTQAES